MGYSGEFKQVSKRHINYGNIDVYAVRNFAGKLTGVKPYNQADFNARTLKIRMGHVVYICPIIVYT